MYLVLRHRFYGRTQNERDCQETSSLQMRISFAPMLGAFKRQPYVEPCAAQLWTLLIFWIESFERILQKRAPRVDPLKVKRSLDFDMCFAIWDQRFHETTLFHLELPEVCFHGIYLWKMGQQSRGPCPGHIWSILPMFNNCNSGYFPKYPYPGHLRSYISWRRYVSRLATSKWKWVFLLPIYPSLLFAICHGSIPVVSYLWGLISDMSLYIYIYIFHPNPLKGDFWWLGQLFKHPPAVSMTRMRNL